MARERISLVSDEIQKEEKIRNDINSGLITKDNYNNLSLEDQEKVNEILFEIAEENINLAQGVSAIEFVLFAYIRLSRKESKGLSLTAEDKLIEKELDEILDTHEITSRNVYKKDWLFDYLAYAQHAANKILQNRKEHIERKKSTTGKV